MITIPDYIAAGLGLKSCELPEDELEGRMLLAGITKGSDVFLSPLLDTVTKAPHVFNDGVFSKLDTVDLMMLSRVNKKMQGITKVHKYTTVTDTKEDIFRVPTFVRSVALLRWARANGCPWDERTCAAVAAGGNLEVLKWARENGCPWDKSTGWADPAIVPFGPMEMNPASAVLHYAIEVGVHRLELRCDLHAAPAARG